MKLKFFLTYFQKNYQILNFMKIHPVGVEFHSDGRTDMTKLIVVFRNFAKAPKKSPEDGAQEINVY